MGKTVLELKNLKKSFGNYSVLDGLSISLEAGELYGFIGANGAGKTTTLKIAAGLLPPDEGEVIICGENLWANRQDMKVSRFILSRIGYVPDSFGVYENMRVSEYMDFFAACYSMNGIRARRRRRVSAAGLRSSVLRKPSSSRPATAPWREFTSPASPTPRES